VDGTSGSETFGQVVERYLYDPYGKVTFLKANWSLQEGDEQHPAGTISAYANELLFTGHRLDPESGLYITLHRHYHPTLGRWMQRDPKGYVNGMSLYEYVGCNPCVRYDSLGLYSWDEFTSDLKLVAEVAVNAVAGAVEVMTLAPLPPPGSREGALARNFGRDAATAVATVEAAVGPPMVEAGVAGAAVGGTAIVAGAVVEVVSVGAATPVVVVVEAGAIPVTATGVVVGAAGAVATLHGSLALSQSQKLGREDPDKYPSRSSSKRDPSPNSLREGDTPATEGEVPKSSKTLRKEWQQETGQQWPKDPKTGGNQDVSHKVPKADGGSPNDLNNIEPKPHDQHMQDHIDNEDFKRWGARGQGGGE
jgi:RHS repeat-associated protein